MNQEVISDSLRETVEQRAETWTRSPDDPTMSEQGERDVVINIARARASAESLRDPLDVWWLS